METKSDRLANVKESKICRACLNNDSQLKSLHINDCAYRFRECTSLNLNKHDNLPQHLCESCYNMIYKFYDFKMLCYQSDVFLRQDSESNNQQDTTDVKFERSEDDHQFISHVNVSNLINKQHVEEVQVKVEYNLRDTIDYMNNENLNNKDGSDDENATSNLKNKYFCDYCSKTYKSKGSYYKHLKVHKKKGDITKSYIREKVHTNTKDTESVNDDDDEDDDIKISTLLDRMRNKLVNFYCKQCDESFATKLALRQHSSLHNLKCKVCDKFYKTKKTLRYHMLTHKSTIDKEVKCELCDKTYKSDKSLKAHLLVHSGIKKHICDICDKAFSQRGALNLHKEVHTGIKKHVCHICGAKFTLSIGLKSHLLRHSKERPFACNKCDKKFITTNELKYHKLRHDGIKNFTCPHCSFKFLFRRDLNKHMKTHSDARPYACDICGKTFKCKPFVKVHRMLHTGERNVQCDYCGRWFRNRKDIKDHIMTHSGVRPYKCEVCKQGFIQKGAFNRHVKSHEVQDVDENRVLNYSQCFYAPKKDEDCLGIEGVYDSFLPL